jgi:hypothetical protein
MFIRKFNYNDIDGNHWPDADVGDELYYAIDFSCWLNNEADTIDSVVWAIPEGIEATDEYIDGTEAVIKLKTSGYGSFKVLCKMTSIDNGKAQTNAVPMVLKVF